MSDPKVTVPAVVIDRAGEAEVAAEPVLISAVTAIAVRALRTFLQVFLAALGAGAITSIFPAGDFQTAVVRAAGIAAASAFISACQNTLELLVRLDQSNPSLRA